MDDVKKVRTKKKI